MKQIIKVYPDYCSSGLWEMDGGYEVNVPSSDFEKHVPLVCLIALKYWHEAWEVRHTEDFEPDMSDAFADAWMDEGHEIVDAMNASQDVYQFVLGVSKP